MADTRKRKGVGIAPYCLPADPSLADAVTHAEMQAELAQLRAEVAMLRSQLKAAEDGRTVDRINAEARVKAK